MHDNMRHHTSTNARGGHADDAVDSSLARLGELHDYKVAAGDPDIRGWEVRTADGRRVGSVADLIVDTAAMRARYVEVRADKNVLGVGADDRYFLAPIGAARLNEKTDDVVIDRLPAGGFTAAWSYERGQLTRRREAALQELYAGGGGETRDLYDDRGFWGSRRRGREDEANLTRSEDDERAAAKPIVRAQLR